MIALADRLPALLRATFRPMPIQTDSHSPGCSTTGNATQPPRGSRAEAMAADPQLVNDLKMEYRSSAACSAAMAGCGLGEDDPPLDDRERAKLRRAGARVAPG